MGAKYQSQGASGYNASPPPDDGSTTSNNKTTWAGVKSKLGDPVKALADAINTALLAFTDFGSSVASTAYTTQASDHMKSIECTTTETISLGDAATMAAGYITTICNTGAGNVTVNLATSANTLDGVSNGSITLAPGQAKTFKTINAATGYVTIATNAGFPSILRSYLAGLTLSTAGSSATFGVTAGQASDSTNALMMTLAAAINKTTSAWAVGSTNGGLDTGSIATNTWYHVYLIQRQDTGVVDVCVSLSASAPTTGGNIPAAYTLSRRIGSMKTDGSSNWTAFTQTGDRFILTTPVLDYNTLISTTHTTFALASVPTGIVVEAEFNTFTDGTGIYVRPVASADMALSQTAAPLGSIQVPTVTSGSWQRVVTNTSAQIRGVCSAGATLRVATLGWIDSRGRNA